MRTLEGLIFDAHLSGRDMGVWVVDGEGQTQRLSDRFTPAFCVGWDSTDRRAVTHFPVDQWCKVRLSWVDRPEPSIEALSCAVITAGPMSYGQMFITAVHLFCPFGPMHLCCIFCSGGLDVARSP